MRTLVANAKSIEDDGTRIELLALNAPTHRDEADEMAGVGTRSGYGLDDTLLPARHRLFLTATPRTFSAAPQQVRVAGVNVADDGALRMVPRREEEAVLRADRRSNDDEALFGPCVFKRTYEQRCA